MSAEVELRVEQSLASRAEDVGRVGFTADDIMRAGRKARIRRRGLGAGSVAIALVAGIVVAGSVVNLGRGAAGSAEAGAGSDSLTADVEFGWLPPGLTERVVMKSGGVFSTMAARPRLGERIWDEPKEDFVEVRVTRDEPEPTPTAGTTTPPAVEDPIEPTASAPAEPVNGHSANWLTDDPSNAVLSWDLAPGQTVEVRVRMGEDARAIARQVVAKLKFGTNKKIALPMRMKTPSSASTFDYVRVVTVEGDSSSWQAWAATYGPENAEGSRKPTMVINLIGGTRWVSETTINGEGGEPVARPDTTVDGYPAHREDGPEGTERLVLFDVNGVFVEIYVPKSTYPGGALEVFHNLTIIRDPANWN